MGRKATCVLCELEAGRYREGERLALAVAYGDLVLGQGLGLATCEEHDEEIRRGLELVRKRLARARRPTSRRERD